MAIGRRFVLTYVSRAKKMCYPGRVANRRPVARIKTGRVAQPFIDAADETGLGFATRPR